MKEKSSNPVKEPKKFTKEDFEKKSNLLKEFLHLNMPKQAYVAEFIAWMGVLGGTFLEIAENLISTSEEPKDQLLGLLQIQHKLTEVLINQLKRV